jgi:S1-C subfamily serine protease
LNSTVNAAEILQTLSSAIEQVAESVSPSVVSVGSEGSSGSGIVWDDKGHIVTAYHVVRGLDEVEVGLEDGRTLSAKVVSSDRRSDVALLKVEEGLSPISKGDSDSLKVGQFVLALANPFATKASATSGIITGVRRNIGGWWGLDIQGAIVTDARVNPGYSGGPLVDASGKMIGMNVARISSRGIAIPIQAISKTVERLASGKPVGRAYLGIISNPVELPADLAGISKQDSGLIVLSVESDSPAKKAGLSLGDVLVGFDGKPVTRFSELSGVLTEDVIGKASKVQVLRGGKLEELSITPGTAPERECE